MNWYRELKKQFAEWREDRALERQRMRQIRVAIEEWDQNTKKLRDNG